MNFQIWRGYKSLLRVGHGAGGPSYRSWSYLIMLIGFLLMTPSIFSTSCCLVSKWVSTLNCADKEKVQLFCVDIPLMIFDLFSSVFCFKMKQIKHYKKCTSCKSQHFGWIFNRTLPVEDERRGRARLSSQHSPEKCQSIKEDKIECWYRRLTGFSPWDWSNCSTDQAESQEGWSGPSGVTLAQRDRRH